MVGQQYCEVYEASNGDSSEQIIGYDPRPSNQGHKYDDQLTIGNLSICIS